MTKIIPLVSTIQFHKWVLAQRDKHKLSQRHLLRLAGLSHATLTKVGINTDMTMSTVAHIAHVFGYRIALVPRIDTDFDFETPIYLTQKSPAENGGALDDGAKV